MKKKIIAVIVFISFLMLALIYFSKFAVKLIEERKHNISGLALDIGGYEIGFLSTTIKLKDIKIYPTNKEEEQFLLASAEKLTIRFAPIDLIRGFLHARYIELKKPQINYIVYDHKSNNWDSLELSQNKLSKDKKNSDKKWILIIDEIEIDDGKVLYKNLLNGQNIELNNVDVVIEDIRPSKKKGDLPTAIKASADIGDTDGKVKIKGLMDLLTEDISFDIDGKLTRTPIRAFESFYAGKIPFNIVSGFVSIDSTANADHNYLNSTHFVTLFDLKAGEGVKDVLINKFILSQNRPVEVEAKVDGDLSAGRFSVSTSLSMNIAEELIRRATLATPEEVIKNISKIKPLKKLRKLFKK